MVSPVYPVVSPHSSHRMLVGVLQQSQCWVWAYIDDVISEDLLLGKRVRKEWQRRLDGTRRIRRMSTSSAMARGPLRTPGGLTPCRGSQRPRPASLLGESGR